MEIVERRVTVLTAAEVEHRSKLLAEGRAEIAKRHNGPTGEYHRKIDAAMYDEVLDATAEEADLARRRALVERELANCFK